MKRIFCIMFEVIFILLFIYGFLCVLGEAEPWTMASQIWLFIKGVAFMLIGFLGCAFIEGRQTA